tara:strand:- start:3602 stop:4690 length:1089 start_codon:yes stop_codon:yes gene_type:complete
MMWNVSNGGKAWGRIPAGAGYITGIALFAVILLGSPVLSMAQSNSEVRALVDRINRLEKDLTDMQRQMYGGASAPRPAPSTGAATLPSGSGSGNISSDGLNLLMQRISALEEEQRSLTGAQEENSHKLNQISTRLDKLVKDVDFRLAEIESRLATSGSVSGAEGSAIGGASAGAGTGPTIIDGSSGQSAPSAQGSGTLGTLSTGGSTGGTSENGSTASLSDGAAAAPAAGQLPSGSAMEQYNYAISLIRDDRYAEAEVAFSDFLKNHKESELAGNAQYWLGETFYVRGNYPNAASAFFEGYQNYPDSSKAADNLLKLAMSLGRMDQKAEACATFAQMDKQFAQVPARLRQTADREKQKYGCS